MIKIETIKPVIQGPVKKFDPLFFKKMHEIASKNDLQVRSINLKNGLSLEFRWEDMISITEDWVGDYAEDIKALKKAVEEIEKESCFIKEKKSKK